MNVIKKQFPLLKKEYILELHKSVKGLNELKGENLDQITKLFYHKFFEKESNILSEMKYILDNNEKLAY